MPRAPLTKSGEMIVCENSMGDALLTIPRTFCQEDHAAVSTVCFSKPGTRRTGSIDMFLSVIAGKGCQAICAAAVPTQGLEDMIIRNPDIFGSRFAQSMTLLPLRSIF